MLIGITGLIVKKGDDNVKVFLGMLKGFLVF